MSSSQSNSRKRSLVSEEMISPMVEVSDDEMQETSQVKETRGRLVPKGDILHPTKKPKDGRTYIIRQNSKRRAHYWIDFTEYFDEKDHLRAECNFCEIATFAADSNVNGSKNVGKHWSSCVKNPANKGKGKQTHLVFDPIHGSEQVARLKYKEVSMDDVRKALIYMIILDELPYRFVEKPGFRYFMSIVCHAFHIPSRITIARDCYQLYLDERAILKNLLETSCQRVCLTTDTWTSNQKINYMCLTAHYLDENWKLQKRILNFCPISSHKGDAIGKAVEDCLNTWGLTGKLFIVTVDNASSNDVACAYLKKLVKKNGGISDGKYLHMRCIAHILNLIVWDGLKDHGKYIDKVRVAIKHVRNSPARIVLFNEQVEKCKIECKLALSLDVPTRWNSTYTMLNTTLKYRDVFSRIGLPNDLEPGNLGPIVDEDWDKIERLVVFLKEFYDLTNRISGSLYVTSNSLFFQIGHTHNLLNDWLISDDFEFQAMANQMKMKYDKYWGDVEKMNKLIYLAVILDPSFKYLGVKIALCGMYGEEKGELLAEKVKDFAYDIYDEYRRIYAPAITGNTPENTEPTSNDLSGSSRTSLRYMSNIEQQVKRQMSGSNLLIRSEFDRYLTEQKGDDEEKDILAWWKANSIRFPILSHMARDVLAMPISTVASEAAFSAGGRTLDSFRSSLTPKMVQAQVCAQDWIRASIRESKLDMEENLDELEKLEKDFEKLKVADETIYVS